MSDNPFVVECLHGQWFAGGRAMLPFQGRAWERFDTEAEAQAWADHLQRVHLPASPVTPEGNQT